MLKLSQITYYPIKSLAGINVSESEVSTIGLNNDRQMMLVDKNGTFVTQRKHPSLALIKVEQNSDGYLISKPESKSLLINSSVFTQTEKQVVVWGDQCQAFVAQKNVNSWFSEYLNFEVELVNYNHKKPRATDPNYSRADDVVSFADGFPLLVISQASLDDLNQRLDEPVEMRNFRPNIVIEGVEAYAEDDWNSITIGDVEFAAVKKCSRCVLTTVDPDTGIKNSKGEPLKTLSKYRRGEGGVIFGMNLIPRTLGRISIDCGIEVT